MLLKSLYRISLALIVNATFALASDLNIDEKFLLLGDFNAISLYNSSNTNNLTTLNIPSIYELSGNSESITQTQLNNLPGTPSIWYPITNDSSLMVIDNKPYIYNLDDTTIQPLSNWNDINGDIETVFYDSEDSMFYFGGSVSFNSTHGAVQYDYLSEQLLSLPFGGFGENSTINTILRELNTNNILFGGTFDTIGYSDFLNITVNQTFINSTIQRNTSSIIDISQKIPILQSQVSATGGQNAGNIICPTDESNGWKLGNGELGSWSAMLQTSVNPSKIRLYNSESNSNGVKSFRVLTYPANGIMNMTYVDPTDMTLKTCKAFCPLFLNSDVETGFESNDITDNRYYTFTNNNQTILELTDKFQDFAFVNPIDVTSFTVQVMDYYGDYAELLGIEMSGVGINVYANEQLNQQDGCSSTNAYDINVNSESIGDIDWLTATGGSYLYANVPADSIGESKGMRFNVQLSVSGQYNVLMYTAGCLDDNSCANRGVVRVTVYNSDDEELSSSVIYQTNEYKKYDVIYTGDLDISYPENNPMYIEMTISQSLNGDDVYVVAESVQLQYIQLDLKQVTGNITHEITREVNGTISLNGLFEYSPNNFTEGLEYPIGNTTFNLIGASLGSTANVNQLLINDTSLIVAGSFESPLGDNIFGADFKSDDSQLEITSFYSVARGANGEINQVYGPVDEFAIFGDFTKFTGNSSDINGAAVFTSSSNNVHSINITNADDIKYVTGFVYNDTEYLSIRYNQSSEVYDFTNDELFKNTTTLGMSILAALDSNSEDWMLQESVERSLVLGYITQFELATNNIVQIDRTNMKSVNNQTISSLTTGAYVDDQIFAVAGSNIYLLTNGVLSTLSENLEFTSGSTVDTMIHYKDSLIFSTKGSATFNGESINGLAVYDMNSTSIRSLNETFQGSISDLIVDPQFGNLIGAGSFSVGDCNNICVFGNDSQSLNVNQSIAGVSGQISSLNYYTAYEVLIAGNFSVNENSGYMGIYNTFYNNITVLNDMSSQLSGPVLNFAFADAEKNNKTLSDVIVVQGSNYVGYFNNSEYTSISDTLNFNNGELTDVSLIDTSSSEAFFQKQVIIITGGFTIEGYGMVSSAIWNGIEWTPYTIAANNLKTENAKAQSVVRMTSDYLYQGTFTSSPTTSVTPTGNSSSQEKNLKDFSDGQVVGVGFALALGTMLLLSAIGFAYYFLSASHQKESLDGLKLDGDDKMY